MKVLDRIFSRLLGLLAWLAAAIIILMTLSVVFEVVMRYFLLRPTDWVIEFSEYALYYILFLAAAWVLAQDGHVKIEMVLIRLSPRSKRILNTITSVIGVVVCGVLFWYGLQITLQAVHSNAIFMRAIIVPKWPILLILPFGSLLLTLQFIRRAWGFAHSRSGSS